MDEPGRAADGTAGFSSLLRWWRCETSSGLNHLDWSGRRDANENYDIDGVRADWPQSQPVQESRPGWIPFSWFGNLVSKPCDCLTSTVNVALGGCFGFYPLTGEKFIRDPRKSRRNPTVAQARRGEHSGQTSPAFLQSTVSEFTPSVLFWFRLSRLLMQRWGFHWTAVKTADNSTFLENAPSMLTKPLFHYHVCRYASQWGAKRKRCAVWELFQTAEQLFNESTKPHHSLFACSALRGGLSLV